MRKIVSFTLAVLTLLSLSACAPKKGAPTTWQEQYDLGVRYLSEGNYEEAVIAFTAAIKIDSKRPEAYLGLSDAYTEQGDVEKAIETLKCGQEQTDDQTIQERLEQLLALQDSGELNSYVVYSYDEQGREIRTDSYDSDGSLIGAVESEYDNVSGELIKQTYYGKENEIKRWAVYYPVREWGHWSVGLRLEYDSNGQPVLEDSENCTFSGDELIQYRLESVEGVSLYEFANEQLVRMTYSAADGDMLEQIYNGARELTNDRYYHDGALTSETTFEYDDANNTFRRWDWSKHFPDEKNPYYWIYDNQGRTLEAYPNGSHQTTSYDANGNMTMIYTNGGGELEYTQTEMRTAMGVRTTTIYPDGSSGGFWEDDIVGNRVEDEHGYTCTRTADGLPLEVYENGALKRSYSYQIETFTITDHQNDTSKTYSMDGVLLTENDGYNNTLYLYDSEEKLVRTLCFANTVS